MRAELKSLDVDGDLLKDVVVDDRSHFVVNVTASIGADVGAGADLFQFTVCSPSWISADHLQKGFRFVRHTLLVDRWDPDTVERVISDLCRRRSGADWSEIGPKLARFGYWEFEDYETCSEGGP